MPNRIIKEAIRTSRDINNLSDFQFRVWAYLITYVDDYGRGSADPELLKGLVFPRRKGVTEKQISEALSVLANTGMISLYCVDGEPYFYFPAWEKHQQIRAKKSKFPSPNEICEPPIAGDSICDHMQANVTVIQSNPNPNTNPNTNTNPIMPPKGGEADAKQDDRFEQFWEAYPRKVGKGNARQAWAKIRVTDELFSTILNAVEQQKQWEQWQRDNGQFIPHPATWLNQQRWEDLGIIVPKKKSKYANVKIN